MEPALGERDDLAHRRLLLASHVRPQWSPLLVSGMTSAHCPALKVRHWPQWSPLLVSGMTRVGDDPVQLEVAAMEPALGERDDQGYGCTLADEREAAMEPALGER